ISKLSDLIRQKYPGSYDSISDADLDKAWLEKYPDVQQYKDLAGQTSDQGPKQPSDISMTIGGDKKPPAPKEIPEPNIWQKANTPLFTPETALSPQMRAALELQMQPSVTETFGDKMARYGENAARYITGKALGIGETMSSPLALG